MTKYKYYIAELVEEELHFVTVKSNSPLVVNLSISKTKVVHWESVSDVLIFNELKLMSTSTFKPLHQGDQYTLREVNKKIEVYVSPHIKKIHIMKKKDMTPPSKLSNISLSSNKALLIYVEEEDVDGKLLASLPI